ncbi:MAG TPA: RHS repeat-associated core domain-containing protein [Polyangiaceae bacterium]
MATYDGGRARVAPAAILGMAMTVALAPGLSQRVSHAFASAHRQPPNVTQPAGGLKFSDPPSDDEIVRSGLFAQPLVPVGPTTAEENRDLAATLISYEGDTRGGREEGLQVLTRFLAAHPGSAWKPALLVDLGAIYRRTGHFSKALATWQGAWDISKQLTDPNGRAVGDVAIAYLSQFEAYLGRKETLAPLLEEAKARPIRGSAAELVSESRRGLADMLTKPEMAFKCGPSALARILATHPSAQPEQSRSVLAESQSTPIGLSLTAVQGISAQAGMDYQMAFRSPGAPLVVPAVAHWRAGHYAALLAKRGDDRYLVADATFGEDIVVAEATLEEETSGYFLVPPGDLPNGWRPVEALEGARVWGRGDTGANHDNMATGWQEIHAFPCPPGGGCSTWNVEAMVVGLSMHDDPVGYTPPIGRAVRFPMDYSHRDMMQPTTAFTYTNFGNKWTTSWLSYVTAHAGCAGFYGSEIQGLTLPGGTEIGTSTSNDCAVLYRRGGGGESYVFPGTAGQEGNEGASQQSALGEFSQAILTEFIDPETQQTTGFQRTLPDGSTERFEDGIGTHNQFFMTQVSDPHGGGVDIIYDGFTRITKLIDAIGQVTRLCYNDSYANGVPGCSPPGPTSPPSNLQVTQVVDPFGRSAFFGYTTFDSSGVLSAASTSHLTSITDVLGITSTFQYAEDSDFISSLTTPYGTTQFQLTDSTDANPTRSVTATDPLGRTSYVEFHQGDATCTSAAALGTSATADTNHIACMDKAAPMSSTTPAFHIYNDLLQYRNTFIWDPYQYLNYSNTPYFYTGAKLIHWLHTDQTGGDTNPLTSSRVPESIKEPLESRVWYNYVNQAGNAFVDADQSPIGVGSTNQPTFVARVLDDGATQLWAFTYTPYGKLATVTDPVGRQLSMTYLQLDLQTVTNTTPSQGSSTAPQDLLLTLQNYNNFHEPGTVIGANGQASALTYNAAGQIQTSTNALGNKWTYSYLPADGGYLQAITGPTAPQPPPAAPQTPQYAFGYDAFGRVGTFVDAAGVNYAFSYDAANRLTKAVFPDQTTELFGYTLLDLTSVTDRRGNSTARQYDADRELTEIDEPSARTTRLEYWPNGLVKTIQDPRGFVTTVLSDIEARAIFESDANGAQTAYVYDGAGRLESVGLPSGWDLTYTYNTDNTIAEFQPADLLPTFFTYDSRYRRMTAWSQASGPSAPSSAVASSEMFTYFPVTSPPSLGANRLQTDQTVTNYIPPPDTQRRCLRTCPPEPVVTTTAQSAYAYDALDRVTSRILTPVVPQNSPPMYWQSVSELWTYDALGRVTTDGNDLGVFAYTYDDPTPRIKSRTSSAGPQLEASYYPAEQEKLLQEIGYTARNGASVAQYTYQYDSNQNVTQFAESYPQTGTTATAYAYDTYNQLLSATPAAATLGGSTGYGYDLAGNLISQTRDIDLSFGFGSGIEVPISSTQTQYDPSNEITTTATGRFSGAPPTISTAAYDVNGDLTSLGGTTYSYDDAGRLTQVTSGSQVSYFTYDGIGRIVQISDTLAGPAGFGIGASITADHTYAWCGSDRCIEFNDAALVQRPGSTARVPAPDKVYFAQGMVALSPAWLVSGLQPPGPSAPVTTPAYYVSDALGSVRELLFAPTQASVSVTDKYEYDPFGNRSTVTGDGASAGFGFAGYFEHPASGLDLTRNRAYNASLGRWLTRDRAGLGVAFADGSSFSATDLNLYSYSGNDGPSLRDPSGNCPLCIPIIIGIVLAYGALAPSDTSQAPADIGSLMSVTSGGLLTLEAAGGECVAGAAASPDIWGGSTAGAAQVRVLQTGGNIIRQSTTAALNEANGLELTSREWGRALEDLKLFEGLPNDFHGAIDSAGNYWDPATGQLLGNLTWYLP